MGRAGEHRAGREDRDGNHYPRMKLARTPIVPGSQRVSPQRKSFVHATMPPARPNGQTVRQCGRRPDSGNVSRSWTVRLQGNGLGARGRSSVAWPCFAWRPRSSGDPGARPKGHAASDHGRLRQAAAQLPPGWDFASSPYLHFALYPLSLGLVLGAKAAPADPRPECRGSRSTGSPSSVTSWHTGVGSTTSRHWAASSWCACSPEPAGLVDEISDGTACRARLRRLGPGQRTGGGRLRGLAPGAGAAAGRGRGPGRGLDQESTGRPAPAHPW